MQEHNAHCCSEYVQYFHTGDENNWRRRNVKETIYNCTINTNKATAWNRVLNLKVLCFLPCRYINKPTVFVHQVTQLSLFTQTGNVRTILGLAFVLINVLCVLPRPLSPFSTMYHSTIRTKNNVVSTAHHHNLVLGLNSEIL